MPPAIINHGQRSHVYQALHCEEPPPVVLRPALQSHITASSGAMELSALWLRILVMDCVWDSVKPPTVPVHACLPAQALSFHLKWASNMGNRVTLIAASLTLWGAFTCEDCTQPASSIPLLIRADGPPAVALSSRCHLHV